MSEWKTQRYEGSVGVDGRWVVSRSEAESRIEAAERELEIVKRERVHRADFDAALARAEAAEKERREFRIQLGVAEEDRNQMRDTLAAVRERVGQKLVAWQREADSAVAHTHRERCEARVEVLREILAILDGEGE